MSLLGTETVAPRSIQSCQAVFCIVCHQINISLAVGGRETVASSVHMLVLKHMAYSCFFIWPGDDKMSLLSPKKFSAECTGEATEVES